ncbi:MAG TPA: cbb3-type cytochrome c oxidase subunit 3 [Xanthobacteraceae bacterium]|nr:cbb3-type cytochrome c oxidase subunit 3 [Xanthobacteraceae bacterium]
MSEWLLTLFLKGWLVVSALLFLAILVLTFRPGARNAMESNARIPFAMSDDQDGQT